MSILRQIVISNPLHYFAFNLFLTLRHYQLRHLITTRKSNRHRVFESISGPLKMFNIDFKSKARSLAVYLFDTFYGLHRPEESR